MNWPLRTPVRAADRLNGDVVDLARDSSDLKRQNAELRQQLAETRSLLDVARERNLVLSTRMQQIERLAHSLKAGAAKNPMQALSRWVKHGPESELLATLTTNNKDKA
ncbi:hypothetical protein AB4Z48_18240 [Cupriavidus sp. 2TAF22]|uniref:hypothetical protein n=1 Tax=unclassified Cupriavidus TaxID=2640874 RepID=UPI003F91DCFE